MVIYLNSIIFLSKKMFALLMLVIIICYVFLLTYKRSVNLKTHSLCVLVPFRDRFNNLLEFGPRLHFFLNEQLVHHEIYILNQIDLFRFNRAALLNTGFILTKHSACDYIALHDVDLIPLNSDISYSWPVDGPVHLTAPGLHPKYDYANFVGGIFLINRSDFENLNGMSNRYWGWGLEDDEFFGRISDAKLKLNRPTGITTGKTGTFEHLDSPHRDMRKCYNQYEVTRKRDRVTGLADVRFELIKRQEIRIDWETDVTVFNIKLECDTSLTPWCNCSNGPKEKAPLNGWSKDPDVIVPKLHKEL